MWGVAYDQYEYRRYESGATPFWTPLRMAGQYHDEETDLNQNGYRFYDGYSDRYFGPDPLWQTPYPAFAAAYSGMTWPVYGYAGNNAVNYSDPTGLRWVFHSGGPSDSSWADFDPNNDLSPLASNVPDKNEFNDVFTLMFGDVSPRVGWDVSFLQAMDMPLELYRTNVSNATAACEQRNGGTGQLYAVRVTTNPFAGQIEYAPDVAGMARGVSGVKALGHESVEMYERLANGFDHGNFAPYPGPHAVASSAEDGIPY